jgi:hypothetical protein
MSRTTGVGEILGVEGKLGFRRLRFQKPALGPLVTKASVQRERPRRVSGRCIAAVISVENDKMKATLDREFELRTANPKGRD